MLIGMPGDVITQRILFMRHPETVSNTEHFYSGRMEVGLSPQGLVQRERAIEAIVAFSPDRIWCSPLSRCSELAEIAAERLGVPCEVNEDLVEIDFGPLEGMKVAQVKESGMCFPWPLDDEGHSCPPEGAESFEHLRARADHLLDTLRPLDGKTACVTHGGFLRMLMAAAYDIPLTRFWDQHILNVASLYFTCDGEGFALGGHNLTPEEVIEHATKPNEYDTRNVWGAGRKELA